MGRRAKNKQGDPAPLAEVNGQAGRPSAKKLGKRKAEFEDDARGALSKRPVKKIKESVKSKPGKGGLAKFEETKKGPAKVDKAPLGKKKPKAVEDEDEEQEEESEGGSSAGWEDINDDEDPEAQRKCVYCRPLSKCIDVNCCIPGRYSMIVTMTESSPVLLGISKIMLWMVARTKSTFSQIYFVYRPLTRVVSDDMLRGPVEELDLGSDDDEEEPAPAPTKLKGKKSKQQERPAKIIPTGSDDSSDEDEDEDGPVTMANMEARSRAMDAKAAREAALDAEEMLEAEVASDDEDLEGMEEAEGEDDGEAFSLPTAEEREEEKKAGGPQVHIVQRRMRECVRILGNFKRLGATGR